MAKIYHITQKNHWDLAKKQGEYNFCSLHRDGFIHCSTESQYLRIANGIFRGQKNLVLLEIDESKIDHEIRYENLEGGTEQFPHIYGAININAITFVYSLECNSAGDFLPPF